MAPGTRLPPKLIVYWTRGEGAAKIDWGVDGDFARCEKHINEAIVKGGGAPLGPPIIAGLCATLHKIATGATPGHAPGESMPGKGNH